MFVLFRLFSASINCLPSYQTTDEVKCDFSLTNNGNRPYSVLKWNTPLNALTPSGLTVFRDRKRLESNGISMKREDPNPRDFLPIVARETVSEKVDISSEYDTSKPGTYTVVPDMYLEYVEGSSVRSVHAPGNPDIKTNLAHLSSPAVSFQVVGR